MASEFGGGHAEHLVAWPEAQWKASLRLDMAG